MIKPNDPNDSLRRFFSPAANKVYSIHLPTTRGRAMYGSPFGWLPVAVEYLSVSLFNPLTRAQIHLPTVSTSPFPNGDDGLLLRARDELVHNCGGHGREHELFGMPMALQFYQFRCGDEWLVVIVITKTSQFMYWRGNDRAWTKLDIASGSEIYSVTFYEGRFYIVDINRDVRVCELGAEAKPVLIHSLRVPCRFSCCHFTVVGGELLMMIVVFNITEEYKWISYNYFKLDAGQLKWVEIEGVGDNTLFLTIAENVISSAAGPGCRRNSIYIGDNMLVLPKRPHRVDMVNIEDCSLESIHFTSGKYGADEMRSTWFIPSLC